MRIRCVHISRDKGVIMEIVERIKDNFNRGFFGKSMIIPELPQEYPAWTLKQNTWIGVAVPVDTYVPFSEQFAQVKICTVQNVQIGDKTYDILMLQCFSMDARNEFASMCKQFVDPGTNGQLRKELISDPSGCWKRWKEMLGNVVSNKHPYDTLGELLVLEKYLSEGKDPRWSGIEHATHDIETGDFSVEVKSTTSRYGYEVTISSVYQLHPAPNKPLYLSFLRFERSGLGRSINEVASSLKRLGYNSDALEVALKKAGLEEGRVARNEKYKILEWKQYLVDDDFPVITESSFKHDRLPQNIVRFTYTVDLSGITGQNQIQRAEG